MIGEVAGNRAVEDVGVLQRPEEREEWELRGLPHRALGLPGVEILNNGEGGSYLCMVPVEYIDQEEAAVAVSEEKIDEYAKSMIRRIKDQGPGSAQRQATEFALVPDSESDPHPFKISDGYHRTPAAIKAGVLKVRAEVTLKTWKQLYNDRIDDTKGSHDQLLLARLPVWMRAVWELSEIDTNKIPLELAMRMLMLPGQYTGKNLGLTSEEMTNAQNVAREHATQWGREPGLILAYLEVSSKVAPDLIIEARERKGNEELKYPNLAILEKFAEIIPEDFDLQRLAMKIAIANNMNSPQVRTVCSALKDCANLKAAERMAITHNWKETESTQREPRDMRGAYDVRQKGKNLFKGPAQTIALTGVRAKLTIERGEEVDEAQMAKVNEALAGAIELQDRLSDTIQALARVAGVALETIEPDALVTVVENEDTTSNLVDVSEGAQAETDEAPDVQALAIGEETVRIIVETVFVPHIIYRDREPELGSETDQESGTKEATAPAKTSPEVSEETPDRKFSVDAPIDVTLMRINDVLEDLRIALESAGTTGKTLTDAQVTEMKDLQTLAARIPMQARNYASAFTRILEEDARKKRLGRERAEDEQERAALAAARTAKRAKGKEKEKPDHGPMQGYVDDAKAWLLGDEDLSDPPLKFITQRHYIDAAIAEADKDAVPERLSALRASIATFDANHKSMKRKIKDDDKATDVSAVPDDQSEEVETEESDAD